IRWEADPLVNLRQEYDRLFWKLPLAFSLHGQNRIPASAKKLPLLLHIALGKDGVKASRYKEVEINQLLISEEKYREVVPILNPLREQTPFATLLALLPTQEAPPALHFATIDKAVHISANEDFLKKLIDQAEARKKSGKKKPKSAREANAAL